MYLLAAALRPNIGDIIFQLIAFVMVLAIPLGIIILVVTYRKGMSRLKRVEDKLDKLLSVKENK
ncbi:hypothetical protein [Litchfieldia salsa]|uniref:DUF4083 domain-containing protein n=1 Tax=Litchfieldia salsa TaxID=930152 RepID=A0A1H0PJW0_9BACI|nr:hypothetical protein [Litchfieldia salsa]SDP05357.1 hypothetical protein SAMN05216565_101352 [Litchfieldia salsa]